MHGNGCVPAYPGHAHLLGGLLRLSRAKPTTGTLMAMHGPALVMDIRALQSRVFWLVLFCIPTMVCNMWRFPNIFCPEWLLNSSHDTHRFPAHRIHFQFTGAGPFTAVPTPISFPALDCFTFALVPLHSLLPCLLWGFPSQLAFSMSEFFSISLCAPASPPSAGDLVVCLEWQFLGL